MIKPLNRKKLAITIGGLCGLLLLMLYMAGVFETGKISPGTTLGEAVALESFTTVEAAREDISEYYEAVGTVRPRTETRIEAQIQARILQFDVNAGDAVTKGQVLIELDDSQLNSQVEEARQGQVSAQAQREQAKQALEQAKAAFTQAEAAYKRVKTYLASEAATRQDMEKAESAYLQAKAGVRQAEDGVRGAQAGVNQARKVVEQRKIALGYTRIAAPTDGQVVRRMAEKGDLAWPGKPLLLLQTRGELRLEAVVREGLIGSITIGSTLGMAINALDVQLEGTVEEIVPSADPVTRTFLVKVALSEAQGLFPGMFGRLLVPTGTRSVVTIPDNAVVRTGQLEMVTLKEDGVWKQVFVKTGKLVGPQKVEVLSGLNGGEILGVAGGSNG